MMRRHPGIAHVEDIESIEASAERAVAEKLARATKERSVVE